MLLSLADCMCFILNVFPIHLCLYFYDLFHTGTRIKRDLSSKCALKMLIMTIVYYFYCYNYNRYNYFHVAKYSL